jgi:uncharacterized protein YcfL
MKKGLALVITQLIVVGAVLALTVVSFAWFTSNTTVNTKNVMITATNSSEVSITPEPDDNIPYKGETGLGYNDPSNPDLILDSPYKAEKKFKMVCKPVDNRDAYAFTTYFTQINIKKVDNSVIDITNDPKIMNSFTFRFHIYDENGIRVASYLPESGTNFITLYESNGEYGEYGSYLYIAEEISLRCGFEVVFLSEEPYAKWLNEAYSEVEAFKYCDYDFMRAMFNITFTAGMNIPAKGI